MKPAPSRRNRYRIHWKCLWILFGSILAIPGYAAWKTYWVLQPRPMGQGPAGPTPDARCFSRPWSERNIVVLALGDSITRGYGASRPLSYVGLLIQNHAAYPDMAGKDLKTIFPNLDLLNMAVDYTTTSDHLERQLPKIQRYPPDVFGIVLITSGGNDLIHDYGRSAPRDGALYGCTTTQAQTWTDNIQTRLRQVLQNVTAKFPGGCEIFLANLYDPTDGVGDPQSFGLPRWPDAVEVLAMTNRKIEGLCDEFSNVHVVDIHTPFLGHGIHCRDWWRKCYRRNDPTWWYSPNLEDPNVRGHDCIRRCFLETIVKTLERRSWEKSPVKASR